MPRHQMTPQAHGKLIEFYGEFGEAASARSRFRIHRAYDALEGMERILSHLDSWQPRTSGNGNTKGTANGKARLD